MIYSFLADQFSSSGADSIVHATPRRGRKSRFSISPRAGSFIWDDYSSVKFGSHKYPDDTLDTCWYFRRESWNHSKRNLRECEIWKIIILPLESDANLCHFSFWGISMSSLPPSRQIRYVHLLIQKRMSLNLHFSNIFQCYVEFDITLRIFVPKINHSRWQSTNIILNRSHFCRRKSEVSPDNFIDRHVKRIISPQCQSPKQFLIQFRIVNPRCQVTEAILILNS